MLVAVEVNQSGAGGAFTSIQAAIDSGAKEIIITDSGTYLEDLQIGTPEDGGPAVTLTSTKTGGERPVITPEIGRAYVHTHRSSTAPDRGAGLGIFSNGTKVSNLIIEGNPDLTTITANGCGAVFLMADDVVFENCLFRPAAGTLSKIRFPNTLVFLGQQGADGVAVPGGRDSDGCIFRKCEFTGMATDKESEPKEDGTTGFLENGQAETLARIDHFSLAGEPVTVTFEDCHFHHSHDAGLFPSDRSSTEAASPITWIARRCRFDAFGKFAFRGRGANVVVEDSIFTRTNQINNGDSENSAVAIQKQGSHIPDGTVTNCLFVNCGSANSKRAYYGGCNNNDAGVLTIDRCTFDKCVSGVGVNTGNVAAGRDPAGPQTIVKNSIFHRTGFQSAPAVDNAGGPLAASAYLDPDGLYEAWRYGLPTEGGHFEGQFIWSAVFNNFTTLDEENAPKIVVENCLAGSIASEDTRPWADVVALPGGLADPANVLGCRLVNGFTAGTTVEGIDTVVRGTPIFLNENPDGSLPYALAPNSPGQGLGFTPLGGQLPGDCNQDSQVDQSDAICLLSYLFLGGPPTELPCLGGGRDDPGNHALLNFNDEGAVDLSDAVAMLMWKFVGGPPHPLGVNCVWIPGCPVLCNP